MYIWYQLWAVYESCFMTQLTVQLCMKAKLMFIYIYLSISSNWFCKSSMRDSIFLSGSFLSALCRSKSSNSEIIFTFIRFRKRSTYPNMKLVLFRAFKAYTRTRLGINGQMNTRFPYRLTGPTKSVRNGSWFFSLNGWKWVHCNFTSCHFSYCCNWFEHLWRD